MSSAKVMYRSLIARIRSAQIGIQLRNDLGESKYQYRRKIDPHYVESPQIRVFRSSVQNGTWLEADDPVENFIDGSPDLDEELVCVAHEFGHHFSADEDIDRAYDALRKRGCYLEKGERLRIISEEESAWEKAKNILEDIGFNNWKNFDVQRENGLGSYRAIPMCQEKEGHERFHD
ncbi:MAG: hypothetical protein AB7F86_07255 [Bdellovibrionales bacterium]